MENLTAVIIRGWYDGVAYYLDEKGRRLSRESKQLIADDELCRLGMICKVEQVGDYEYKILSSRVDK